VCLGCVATSCANLKFYQRFLSVRDIPVPVVAAINGPAIGAGAAVVRVVCALLLRVRVVTRTPPLCPVVQAFACDIRVAAENAKIGVTFVKLGLHPGN